MLEFPGFCYLDVQKTGSSFIRRFILSHSKATPIADTPHARVRRFVRRHKYHFTSCRNPLDQYRSLYTFGCDGKGGFFARQKNHQSDLLPTYDGTREGFHRWLRVLLSDDRWEYLPPPMRVIFNPSLGLMTSRFLRLNLLQPKFLLCQVRGHAALDLLWRTRRLPMDVVRQEHLREDLSKLVVGPLAPYLEDVAVARDDLFTRARENTSSSSKIDLTTDLPSDLETRLRDLEWFHYEILGYAA